jgi:hypothetical protein
MMGECNKDGACKKYFWAAEQWPKAKGDLNSHLAQPRSHVLLHAVDQDTGELQFIRLSERSKRHVQVQDGLGD